MAELVGVKYEFRILNCVLMGRASCVPILVRIREQSFDEQVESKRFDTDALGKS
jgi:hypothetical protein